MARSVCKIKGIKDLLKTSHTASIGPHFYDSNYKLVKRPHAIPIDEKGRGAL